MNNAQIYRVNTAQMQQSQSIKNAFMVGTRNSMISVGQMLGRNLLLSARPDPHKPIIISVHGTEGCGKSLISEVMAESINGLKYTFDLASCLRDHVAKSDYEMQFLDIAYPGRTRIERLCAQDDRIAHALSIRQKQGVSFFHNAPEARPDLYDVDIRVCSVGPMRNMTLGRIYGDDFLQPITKEEIREQGLLEAYNRHARYQGKGWVRYLAIDIRNPEVFKPEFVKQASQFSDPAARVRLASLS